MKEFLSILGSLIVAVSFIPYLIQTAQKKIKPRIATWITWSLLTSISTVAAISVHAYTSALLTGGATVVEVLVLIYALKNGDTTYKWLDGISQAISIIGIAAWLLTKNPSYAILFNIFADISANIPTLYHGWVKPHEEAWPSFIIFGFGAFITIFGVTTYDFANLAFPIYFTIDASILGLDILIRQKIVKA